MKKVFLMLALVAMVFATGCKKESETPTSGVENGHEWVDLGLPSGTLWATCNVGADTPEDYGDYFAWGETESKLMYNWDTYKYANGEQKLTKYCDRSSSGYDGFTDTLTVLEPIDDAATFNWGEAWRTPTFKECEELNNNCKRSVVNWNGVNGTLFVGPNGNSVFFPLTGARSYDELYGAGTLGRYWSSSLYTNDVAWYSCHLFVGTGSYHSSMNRENGLSVRPVCIAKNITQ